MSRLRCAVFRFAYLAGLLWCSAGGSLFLPRSIVMAAAQERQQDEKKATAVKPKKVITNDDIKSSPFAGFGGLFYTNSGSVNDCDANCFDQVRLFAQLNADKNSDWRRDVLKQLDQVRSDGEWQAYLHELYEAHQKVCQLTFDKADELRRSGNTRNLGPQEIAITDRYDAKMKAAQAELSAAVASATTRTKKYVALPPSHSVALEPGKLRHTGF